MNIHDERVLHAQIALDGLSVGDALGEVCAYGYMNVRKRISGGDLPPGPWWYTDDTELALAVLETLLADGRIEQDRLARAMADRYRRNPDRGYGKMARMILRDIGNGVDWRLASSQAFSGGSMGNGAAMRVAPLGAYYAEDLGVAAEQAAASAQITHYHPEGIAGAVAVAIAAAAATQCTGAAPEMVRCRIRDSVLSLTPNSETRKVIGEAFGYSFDTQPQYVAKKVGNGSLVISSDTVPFCLWNACRCLDDYQEAFMSTVEVGGDCDTNCAIVGGIVASFTGRSGIPELWLQRRESLDLAWRRGAAS